VNNLKNQKGAALVFELIILAAVLVVAGFAGYQYVKNVKAVNKATTPKPHVAAKASPSSLPDPTASWKTYHEVYENASYKYPPSWNFAVSDQPFTLGEEVETDTLTSPTGFTLAFSSPLQGIGGACGTLDDTETVYSADQLSMTNVNKPVYLVVEQLVSNGIVDRHIGLEELAQAPTLRAWNTCGVNFDLSILNSHGKDHLLLSFGGGYAHGAQQNSLSFSDYQKLPDVVNAELILKSLTFATPE